MSKSLFFGYTVSLCPTADWLPHLRGMDLTDDDVNQRYDTKRCGQICIAFGFVFMHHGRDVAALC